MSIQILDERTRTIALATAELYNEHGPQSLTQGQAFWVDKMTQRCQAIRARRLDVQQWRASMMQARQKQLGRENLAYHAGVVGAPIKAYVNYGRWVADCEYCRSAELVAPGDEFYCFNCGMQKNDGHPRPLEFPADATWAEIETILAGRPLEKNQNWLPQETVIQLQVENRKQGVEV